MATAVHDVIRISALACVVLNLGACGDDDASAAMSDAGPREDERDEPVGSRGYLAASVVFGDVTNSYVTTLDSLELDEVPLQGAREFPGWADAWVHAEHVFVSDGEAPQVTRYEVGDDGALVEGDTVRFEGARSAAFWTNLFVAQDKAYLFEVDNRRVVVWDPERMEIGSEFELPVQIDRGAQLLQVPSTDRSSLVRGKRAYVPMIWADFDEFSISDDSIIVVIDIESDEVVDVIEVDCPNLNVATIDDDGDIYFSNWVFGAISAVVYDRPASCAVRIPAGSETLDDWRLKFSDVTDGREAASLKYIGDGLMLMSVFHHERVEDLSDESDPDELVGSTNWRFWTLDLEAMEAKPVTSIEFNAGGVYGQRIGDEYFLLVPSADYDSTTAHVWRGAEVKKAWTMSGWSTRLFPL
jgi:hypothetical protein